MMTQKTGRKFWVGWAGGENMRKCPLTHVEVVISCLQQTRQASIRKDTLKFGGFLFFRRAA